MSGFPVVYHMASCLERFPYIFQSFQHRAFHFSGFPCTYIKAPAWTDLHVYVHSCIERPAVLGFPVVYNMTSGLERFSCISSCIHHRAFLFSGFPCTYTKAPAWIDFHVYVDSCIEPPAVPGFHLWLAGFPFSTSNVKGFQWSLRSLGLSDLFFVSIASHRGGSPSRRRHPPPQTLGSSESVTFLPDARLAMQEISAELARVTVEHKRLQRQAQKERSRRHKQQEHAFLTATVAFCHEPTAGPTIAEATLRKYPKVMDEDVANFIHKITTRFLETPVDTLAQWLDWSEDLPRAVRTEAQRLVDDARLLRWIGEQHSGQGVAPPPQFVWEKRCALAIDNKSWGERGAASWRSASSAAAKKWMQRFRQRWNLSLGRLPVKDILPTETMQAKARSESVRF